MAHRRKIVLVGAGSYYFHTVIGELLVTPELEGSDVMLFDIEKQRMDITYGLGKQLIRKAGKDWRLFKSLKLERAIDGADFAISSIGVHGPYTNKGPDLRWHLLDQMATAKHGIIHTTGDTVGPAGISQGLRIIPIYLNLARKMEKYCPNAILLNHSNPMVAICRAVTKYSKIDTIGYCHNVYGDLRRISEMLDIPVDELDATSAGLNHMGWFIDIRHKGKDIYPVLKKKFLSIKRPGKGQRFAQELFRLLGVYPIGGDRHMIEFFPHARINSKTRRLAYGLQWRTDLIKQANLLGRELRTRDKELEAAGEKEVTLPTPDRLTPETMGQQIKCLSCGPGRLHFVNVPNQGAVTNLPDWAVVEVKALVAPGGAKPIYAGELPPQVLRWSLAQLYAFELTVDAAAEQSRAKALQAMAADPMIRDFKEAEKVLDAIVKAQGDRLKAFRKTSKGGRTRRR